MWLSTPLELFLGIPISDWLLLPLLLTFRDFWFGYHQSRNSTTPHLCRQRRCPGIPSEEVEELRWAIHLHSSDYWSFLWLGSQERLLAQFNRPRGRVIRRWRWKVHHHHAFRSGKSHQWYCPEPRCHKEPHDIYSRGRRILEPATQDLEQESGYQGSEYGGTRKKRLCRTWKAQSEHGSFCLQFSSPSHFWGGIWLLFPCWESVEWTSWCEGNEEEVKDIVSRCSN